MVSGFRAAFRAELQLRRNVVIAWLKDIPNYRAWLSSRSQ